MNALEKLRLLGHIIRWRLTWSKRDLDYRPTGEVSKKFITAREAARKIPDGACVVSSGLAGNARCSVFFWAIRENYLEEGHPRDLTWMNVGAQGSRGRVPGTVEELDPPGLLARYITGHHETAKSLLRLAEAGKLQLYTAPQGVMSLSMEAQAGGETELRSPVGVGTFLDPRTGRGTAVTPGAPDPYVRPDGDHLIYHLPRIDVALFNAPYADAEGNIYFHHAAVTTENVQSSHAARANGGLAIATVSGLIPKDEKRISMRAGEINFIVVHPHNEQTASIRQRRYWPLFTVGAAVDVRQAMEKVKFINTFLKITPVRTPVDHAFERLAASLFSEVVPTGTIANIGVGHPEEVARYVIEQGLGKELTFTTESGCYGGLPAPGIFFSAAILPEKLITSAEMFRLYQRQLGVTILGFLQVDSEGNVNVSKRGPKLTDYVGPGGFPDIVHGARIAIFVGSWMASARFQITDGRVVIEKPGQHKFVEQVDEVTFSAKEGLKQGKQVYYVTHVGAFKLTPEGLLLIYIMPGIDIQRDIIEACPARILLPDGEVPVVERSVVTGEGFVLRWKEKELES